MSIIIQGAGEHGKYEIANSCRFEPSRSTYLSRTPGSDGNRQIWTWSGWIKRGDLSVRQGFHAAGNLSDYFEFFPSGTLAITFDNNGNKLITSRVYRDTSSYYHISVVVDTSQATPSNRVKVYTNGVLETSFSSSTYPTLNLLTSTNLQSNRFFVGIGFLAGSTFSGLLTDVNFIDGQALLPTDFGFFDANNNWQPKKYSGTYGTNGFFLEFKNAAALGTDTSGNANTFTPSGLVATDQLVDTPTDNYATLNPLAGPVSGTLTEGNTKASGANHLYNNYIGTVAMKGKTYVEVTAPSSWVNNSQISLGIMDQAVFEIGVNYITTSKACVYFSSAGFLFLDGALIGTFGYALQLNDLIGMAYDEVAGTLSYYVNGTYINQITGITKGDYNLFLDLGIIIICPKVNFGQSTFTYTPPAGFKTLSTKNLPDPIIKKPTDYFLTTLDTGSGAAKSITDVGFSPDLTWRKNRDAVTSYTLFDQVRGATKYISSDSTVVETTDAQSLTSFDASGFSLGTSGAVNTNGQKYVNWNWLKSITAGFDIVTDIGTGAAHTISHNLGAVPEFIIRRGVDSVLDTPVYHVSNGAGTYQLLDTTGAKVTDPTVWNNVVPSSTVFSVGTSTLTNTNLTNYITYLFAGIEGYSKFGSYTGNGNVDGTFVYCGFRPAFVIIKRIDAAANWDSLNNKTDLYNVMNKELTLDASAAETTAGGDRADYVSNGFKLRSSGAAYNASGGTYIYAAFAETPFKYANAR